MCMYADKDIHVTIEAESDGFLIKCNGHSFQYKFKYRAMPVTNIRHITTTCGSLRINNASCKYYYTNNYIYSGPSEKGHGAVPFI